MANHKQLHLSTGAIDKSLAEISLVEFVKQAWHIIEPRTRLLWTWHLDLICELLEEVAAGKRLREIINCPPRLMKSILVSVMWPCWVWTTRPETRWVFASYSSALAVKH